MIFFLFFGMETNFLYFTNSHEQDEDMCNIVLWIFLSAFAKLKQCILATPKGTFTVVELQGFFLILLA